MLYVYDKDGNVVAFNRGPKDNQESFGTLVDTSILTYGKKPEYYVVINGVFQVRTQEEIDAIEGSKEYDKAKEKAIDDLEKKYKNRRKGDVTTDDLVRQIVLLNKKIEGTITPQEEAELYIDSGVTGATTAYEESLAWLEDESRTLEDYENYDAKNDPNWP